MINQREAIWWRQLNGALRLALVKGIVPGYAGTVVSEYPKSGGSWMAQMLAKALGMPFPRNRLPSFRSSILHGHYLPKQVRQPCITIWRDGRDVMVSLYHHRVGENSYAIRGVNAEVRRRLSITDPNDIHTYLPRFIEHICTNQTFPRYHWGHFVHMWKVTDVTHLAIRYEDMLSDSAGELQSAALHLGHELTMQQAQEIASEFTFTRQSGRDPGTEDKQSYLRKGVSGDWKNSFSNEAREVFRHHMGDALIEMGYEADNFW